MFSYGYECTPSKIMSFKLTFLKLTLLYCDTGVIVGRMPIALGNSHTHTHMLESILETGFLGFNCTKQS